MNAEQDDLQQRLRRVEALVESLENCPDAATRELARELVRALLNLHTAGLAKFLELAGPDAAARCAADPLVSGILLLHGLHPLSAEERLRRALEQARPRFHARGGEVELMSATDEAVRLRISGDPASGDFLRALAAELVVEAAPDAALEFEESWDVSPNGRVALPVVSVRPAQARRGT